MTLAPKQNPLPLFPNDLLESKQLINDSWWVAHTKSRREKALAHLLASRGVGYFLPLFQKRQPNRQRDRYSLAPMFAGYLFFVGGAGQRLLALQSNHVAGIIQVEDREKLLGELRQIKQALAAKVPVHPATFLNKGQKVRIRSGLLEGLEGIIDRKGKNHRLILSVTTISQAMAVDVDEDVVEVV